MYHSEKKYTYWRGRDPFSLYLISMPLKTNDIDLVTIVILTVFVIYENHMKYNDYKFLSC